MGMLVYFNSKLNLLKVGVVIASINNTKVIKIWPETRWSSLDQVDLNSKKFSKDCIRVWAIYWSELRLGVKVQSNLV